MHLIGFTNSHVWDPVFYRHKCNWIFFSFWGKMLPLSLSSYCSVVFLQFKILVLSWTYKLGKKKQSPKISLSQWAILSFLCEVHKFFHWLSTIKALITSRQLLALQQWRNNSYLGLLTFLLYHVFFRHAFRRATLSQSNSNLSLFQTNVELWTFCPWKMDT